VRKAASRVVPDARGKTQRRDREVLFYSDLHGFLPSPRTFTLRDRILRIRAAALFLPVLYAVIDPTYAVEAILGDYLVRQNLWMYLEDAGHHGGTVLAFFTGSLDQPYNIELPRALFARYRPTTSLAFLGCDDVDFSLPVDSSTCT